MFFCAGDGGIVVLVVELLVVELLVVELGAGACVSFDGGAKIGTSVVVVVEDVVVVVLALVVVVVLGGAVVVGLLSSACTELVPATVSWPVANAAPPA